MSLTYEATYSGRCYKCQLPFQPGTLITHEDKAFSKAHAQCPDLAVMQDYAVPELENIEPFKVLAEAIAPHLAPKIDESKLAAEVEGMVREHVKNIVVPQNITIKVD